MSIKKSDINNLVSSNIKANEKEVVKSTEILLASIIRHIKVMVKRSVKSKTVDLENWDGGITDLSKVIMAAVLHQTSDTYALKNVRLNKKALQLYKSIR